MNKNRIKKSRAKGRRASPQDEAEPHTKQRQDLRAAKASMKCAARNAAEHNNNNLHGAFKMCQFFFNQTSADFPGHDVNVRFTD